MCYNVPNGHEILLSQLSHTPHKRTHTPAPNVSNNDREWNTQDRLSEGVNAKRCEQTKWIHLRLLLNYFSGSRLLSIVSALSTVIKTQVCEPWNCDQANSVGVVSNLPFSFNVKTHHILFILIFYLFVSLGVVRCCFTTPWFSFVCQSPTIFMPLFLLVLEINCSGQRCQPSYCAAVVFNVVTNIMCAFFLFRSFTSPLPCFEFATHSKNVNNDRHVQISPSNVIA